MGLSSCRSTIVPYLIALLVTSGFVVIQWQLEDLLAAQMPMLMLTLPVFVSAYIGGVGPGLLATVVAAGAGQLLFVGDTSSFRMPGMADQIRLGVFLVVGGSISLLVERLRRLHSRERLHLSQLGHVQEQSEARQEKFRAMFERAAIGMGRVSFHDARWIDVNEAFCRMLGYSVAEMRSMPWPQITHPDDVDLDMVPFRRMAAGELDSYVVEKRFIHKQGDHVWARLTLSLVRDGIGRPDYEIAVIEDITQRKQAEARLAASEERYRLLNRATHDVIWDWDLTTDRLGWNDSVHVQFGYSPEELEPTIVSWYDRIHPDDRERVVQGIHRAIDQGEKVWNDEYRFRCKDGSYAHVLDRGFILRDETGRGRRMIGSMIDLTERMKLENALRESENRFRQAFEHAPVAMALTCPDGRFQEVNRAYCRLVGYDEAELLQSSLTFKDLTHPEDLPANVEQLEKMLAGEVPAFFHEKRYIRKDGQAVWVRASVTARRDAEGEPFQLVAIIEDVSARRQAEQALERRTRSLTLLSESATGLLLEDSPERVMARMFDALAGELELDAFINYLVEDDGTLRANVWAGIAESEMAGLGRLRVGQGICGRVAQEQRPVVVGEVQQSSNPQERLVRSLGFRAYVCYPLLAKGRLTGTLSFGTRRRDRFDPQALELLGTFCNQVAMSLERRRLLTQLEQRADQLAGARRIAEQAKAAAEEASAAKDRFLAVLSHELRTPLTPVLASVSLLQRNSSFDDRTRQSLEMIRRNVELEARLIDDLLDLTRIARGKVELHRRPVDLGTVLERAVDVCRPDMEARGQHFAIEFDRDEPTLVDADVARLQQVFWNLLKNSIKFTPHGGCIALRVRREGNRVLSEVIDSGVGIESEALPRIFDAFAQADQAVTRRFGGLGLGLAISKSLVELHGGSIEAHSAGKDRGATFCVRLPLHAEDAATIDGPAGAKGRPPDPRSRALRVLLVEDHGDTAEMMRTLLEAEGHTVETAGDVAEGVAAAGRDRFDVLISDLGLPDGSGLDLIREIRARGFQLPAIALSGYGQEHDVRQSLAAGFAAHVVKPVDVDRLVGLLAGIVEPDR